MSLPWEIKTEATPFPWVSYYSDLFSTLILPLNLARASCSPALTAPCRLSISGPGVAVLHSTRGWGGWKPRWGPHQISHCSGLTFKRSLLTSTWIWGHQDGSCASLGEEEFHHSYQRKQHYMLSLVSLVAKRRHCADSLLTRSLRFFLGRSHRLPWPLNGLPCPHCPPAGFSFFVIIRSKQHHPNTHTLLPLRGKLSVSRTRIYHMIHF